jgi:bisanhydrobacterioruberin hydratase
MHSISQTYLKVLLFVSTICLFVGYNMTWQTQAVLHSPVAIVSLFCLAAPAYLGLTRVYGTKKTLSAWLTLGALGITIETIGIATGIPYGSFAYNNPLGGLLFGYAPWALVLAWPPLVVGAWVLAKKNTTSRTMTIALGTLLLVCFDLVMDPGAVTLGFWSFVQPGNYYDVPYTNFLGWIVSGCIGISTLEALLGTHTSPYTFTTLSLFCSTALWTGVAIGHQHIIPAIIGLLLCIGIAHRTAKAEPMILTK